MPYESIVDGQLRRWRESFSNMLPPGWYIPGPNGPRQTDQLTARSMFGGFYTDGKGQKFDPLHTNKPLKEEQ